MAFPTAAATGAIPEGAQLGLGTRLAAIRIVNIQGPLANTGNRLDIAINGRLVSGRPARMVKRSIRRAGAFNTNDDGQIVTSTAMKFSPQ